MKNKVSPEMNCKAILKMPEARKKLAKLSEPNQVDWPKVSKKGLLEY